MQPNSLHGDFGNVHELSLSSGQHIVKLSYSLPMADFGIYNYKKSGKYHWHIQVFL